jgi:lipopolysaccharide assembly outer membrane protein LptD (OstA)
VVVEQAPSAGDRVGERTLAYGDRAEAVFVDGVVDSLVVEGSATSDHYPAPVDLAAGSGVNHSRAQRIVLYMEEGRARRIRLAGDAAGRYWFEPESTGAPAESSVRAGGASGSDVPDSSAAPDTTAAPDTIATPDATAAPPDSSLPAPETDARATDRSAVPAGDTLQVLTLSAILAPPPPEPAPVDSAAADSIAWAERVRSLDAITPPDSLFPAGIDDVTYGGDVVEFEVETREIRLRKNAKVEYHDATLRSGEVVFDAARQEVDATDEPVLSDPGGTLTGRTMCYDVESREGVVFEGRTEFEGGYYSGRRIKKLEDDDLLVDHAVYTTCDRLEPHFHFLAPSMRIRLRDKVVGRPMVLHIARIPVLAVPFFVFPIEKGRRSGFLTPEIEVGISDDRGRFVRNLGYYWAFSDYVDATTWLDFFERNPRWIGYLQSRYKKRYLLEGQVYASAALELPERETSPDIATGRSRRWELRARHSQELSPTASLKLDANFVSDQQFLFDQGLGTNVEQQADRLLRSNLTLSKSWPEASLTVNMSRRQDLEARGGEIEVASTAPSITFGLNRRTLGRRAQGRDKGRLPWLASVSYGWSARLEQPVTQVKGGDTSRDAAMVQDLSVSDSRKLLGVIGILPTFSYSEFLFERDNRGERWQRAGRWSAGMSANTTLYGTFTPPFGPVAAFRHVMVPSVTFSYHPRITSGTYVDDTGRTVARFPSVGGISFGNAARSRRLGLSIQNRFQAKIRSGDTVRKLDELASLSLSTSYDFEKDKEPLAPISSSFRTRPLNAFNLDLSAVYDPYEERLTSLSVSTNASISGAAAAALPAGHEFAGDDPSLGRREGLLGEEERAAPGQPWRLSLGHTYSRGRSSSDFTSTLRGQLGLSLTRNWQLSYSANVDMREREFVTHSLSVHRDLHCWQAQFERRFFRGSASYYFRIGVKDIQEVFYERRGGS